MKLIELLFLFNPAILPSIKCSANHHNEQNMKKLYCFAALTLLSFSLFTQTNDCSLQEIPETYRNYMIETGQFVQNSASSRQGATRDIALNLILVVYDDGPLVTPQLVQQKVDSANVIYSPIGIRFQICSIRYVDYPGYLSFIPGYITWSNEIENAVLQEGYLPGYLNIIYGSGDGPNATLPGIYNGDRILMNAGPNRVFTHEIGHYFSLWHTHAFNGYSTNIYTLELVDGSNCETEGDFICDTPADPGLYGRASAFPDCQYTDTVSTDANGDLYQPDVNNYMSAAPPGCQIQFTQGQYDRMAYALYHERAVLKTGQAGVTMHEIPMKMCITDDPVALSSDIPGGVFSGNGVTGNFLTLYTCRSGKSYNHLYSKHYRRSCRNNRSVLLHIYVQHSAQVPSGNHLPQKLKVCLRNGFLLQAAELLRFTFYIGRLRNRRKPDRRR
ncbi:MAG: M43 family zinc metalloprotease [Bacteroidia bacterium]